MTAVYTVREVASLLRCSPQTVYKAIDAGQLPAVRLMGVTRVPVNALAALTIPHSGSTVASTPFSHDSAVVVEEGADGAVGADAASTGTPPCDPTAPTL